MVQNLAQNLVQNWAQTEKLYIPPLSKTQMVSLEKDPGIKKRFEI